MWLAISTRCTNNEMTKKCGYLAKPAKPLLSSPYIDNLSFLLESGGYRFWKEQQRIN